MEVNTVVISIERYEKFKLAEKKLKKPRSKTIIITKSWGSSHVIQTDDECTEELANELKESREEICRLNLQLNRQREVREKVEEITIGYLKKMNYWSFCKWKKRNNEK